ncbi:MAG: proton-conducting transporter membrane subunit [Desulfurivibrionaceae bacterium]
MVELYLAAVSLIFCSGLPALAWGRWAKSGEILSVVLLLTGATLGLGAALAGAWQTPAPLLAAPWAIPGGNFLLELDGLAALFLLPALLILGLGSVYGLGYFPQVRHGAAAGRLRLFYGMLGAAIVLLPVSRNGILFLIAWEVMAIGSFLLILTEQKEEEARRAAYVYLAATHTGTLALFAMFILLAGPGGNFDFPLAATLDGATFQAGAIFLLALFGFGLKAGVMPLHIWLPGAHAAAPSHVSALMSGVVIKMGIYGLVRVASFYTGQPAWWGGSILVLGVVSAIMGVVFALAQHDIKRLLAYHSVENIGIILIGLGCALLGKTFHNPALVVLGLAGALLHVVNHGLFKSLLFLGAGAVIQATGTREIDRYGGLLRSMPRTAFFFLGGAVAICGLPPLNGFVSEWLIYLGLLHSQAEGAPFPLSLTILAAPALAMTGALAVACFVKVFGVTFLGTARRQFPVSPGEAPGSMLLPMGSLLFCCLIIGLAPWTIVPLLQRAVGAWLGTTVATLSPAGSPESMLIGSLAPVYWLSLCAFLLLALSAGFFLRQKSFPEPCREKRPATWGCGYREATPRMQYTAVSFAEMLVSLFRWGLWSDIAGGRAIGFFPAVASLAAHTPDLILDRLIHPTCRALSRTAFAVRAFLHQGWIGIYLLYTALTLCLLLLWL